MFARGSAFIIIRHRICQRIAVHTSGCCSPSLNNNASLMISSYASDDNWHSNCFHNCWRHSMLLLAPPNDHLNQNCRQFSKCHLNQCSKRDHSLTDDDQSDGDEVNEKTEELNEQPSDNHNDRIGENQSEKIVLSEDERIPGQKMLQRILHEYKQQNISFILPFDNDLAMRAIIVPIQKLLAIGIEPEFFVDACISVREFFTAMIQKGPICMEIIELLVDHCNMTYEDSIRFFATYTNELLKFGIDEVRGCLDVLNSFWMSTASVGTLVRSTPAIIFAQKSAVLLQNAENLHSHFTRAQLQNLVKSSPLILLCDTNEIQDKIEYAYCHMLIEGEEFDGCRRFADISLNELIDRHEFLLKTGIYKTPDPRRPQYKMQNPAFKKIVDWNGSRFATELAQCSSEEWELFRQIQERERQLEADGKVRTFERIKPSMRKKFERRPKRDNNAYRQTSPFESAGDRY